MAFTLIDRRWLLLTIYVVAVKVEQGHFSAAAWPESREANFGNQEASLQDFDDAERIQLYTSIASILITCGLCIVSFISEHRSSTTWQSLGDN